MPSLILANEETAVARSGAGWFEDMRDKNQDKRLWQSQVGNDGRAALTITAGTENLLTAQDRWGWPDSERLSMEMPEDDLEALRDRVRQTKRTG